MTSPRMLLCARFGLRMPLRIPDQEEVIIARMVIVDEYEQEAPGVPPAILCTQN